MKCFEPTQEKKKKKKEKNGPIQRRTHRAANERDGVDSTARKERGERRDDNKHSFFPKSFRGRRLWRANRKPGSRNRAGVRPGRALASDRAIDLEEDSAARVFENYMLREVEEEESARPRASRRKAICLLARFD